MLKKTSLLTVIFVLLCCVGPAYAQEKKPSTPEQRQRAVEMITFLETNPLAKEAKDYRNALLYFLVDVPDINVTICLAVLGESKKIKGDYEAELVSQMMYSQAKFVIENYGKAQEDSLVYLAGVEGVLRTWQAVKTAKPKAKFPLLDELTAKQQAGTLAEYVQAGMKGCTSKK